jgi:ketosteroid isomerase-like protein
MTDEAESDAEVMAAREAWSRALWARDLDALHACYADDVRVFHVATQLEGFEPLRALWQGCLPSFPTPPSASNERTCDRSSAAISPSSPFSRA